MYNENINDNKVVLEKELVIEKIEKNAAKKFHRGMGIGVIGGVLLVTAVFSVDLGLAKQLFSVNSGFYDMFLKAYDAMKAIGLSCIGLAELSLIKTAIDEKNLIEDINDINGHVMESEGRSR